MKFGLFMMPSHPPERGLYESHQWDLDYLTLTDELGFEEAWIGEHFTSPWEPIPDDGIERFPESSRAAREEQR